MCSAIHDYFGYIFLIYGVLTLSNKDRLCCTLEKISNSQPIVLQPDSSEEEIANQLRQAPLELTVKIAAAIGHVWRESS